MGVGVVSLIPELPRKSLLDALPGTGAAAGGIPEEEYTVFVMVVDDSGNLSSRNCEHDGGRPYDARWDAFTAALQESVWDSPVDAAVVCCMRPAALGHAVDADDDMRAATEFFQSWADSQGDVAAIVEAMANFSYRGGAGALQEAKLILEWELFPESVRYVNHNYDQRIPLQNLPVLPSLLPKSFGAELRGMAQEAVDKAGKVPTADICDAATPNATSLRNLVKTPEAENIIAIEIFAKASKTSTDLIISYFTAKQTADATLLALQTLAAWPSGPDGFMMAMRPANQITAADITPYCYMPSQAGHTLQQAMDGVLYNPLHPPVLLRDCTDRSTDPLAAIDFHTPVDKLGIEAGARVWVVATFDTLDTIAQLDFQVDMQRQLLGRVPANESSVQEHTVVIPTAPSGTDVDLNPELQGLAAGCADADEDVHSADDDEAEADAGAAAPVSNALGIVEQIAENNVVDSTIMIDGVMLWFKPPPPSGACGRYASSPDPELMVADQLATILQQMKANAAEQRRQAAVQRRHGELLAGISAHCEDSDGDDNA